MKREHKEFLFILIGLLCITSIGHAKLIFFDDFNGSVLDVTNDWFVGTNTVGRTQFGLTPTLSSGLATFEFNTYNPNDPGGTFKGTDIFTQTEFSRGQGKKFETRLRVNPPIDNGLVLGIFPFGFDNNTLLSDEIDLELLSNWLNDPSLSNQVKLVTWDNINQVNGIPQAMSEMDVSVNGFDAFDFNTYRIDWLPDRVDWYVNDNLIHSELTVVPDDPMNFHLNFWAPNSNFATAFDANLQPVTNIGSNDIRTFDVDYVRVSAIPEPSTYILVCIGLGILGITRIRKSQDKN